LLLVAVVVAVVEIIQMLLQLQADQVVAQLEPHRELL
jgi:hypothetical protein